MTEIGPGLMYGPEVWRVDVGVEWSYWDLWFALLCTRDHGGDWDGLDTAITQSGRSDGEAKWSHLQDLRERHWRRSGSVQVSWWRTRSDSGG